MGRCTTGCKTSSGQVGSRGYNQRSVRPRSILYLRGNASGHSGFNKGGIMSSKQAETVSTLTVRNQEIPVITKFIPQMKLKFYRDNPRIYSIVRADGKEPSQEEIYKRLTE